MDDFKETLFSFDLLQRAAASLEVIELHNGLLVFVFWFQDHKESSKLFK